MYNVQDAFISSSDFFCKVITLDFFRITPLGKMYAPFFMQQGKAFYRDQGLDKANLKSRFF